MQVINIKKWIIEIWTQKEKITTYNITYFSYLWSELIFWTDKWDIKMILYRYQIYINGKLRWSNVIEKK